MKTGKVHCVVIRPAECPLLIETTPQCPAVERFTVGAGNSGFPTGGETSGL